jgi:hypothetical protein
VAIGQMHEVKAAIHRRGQPAALPAALAAQVRKYSGDAIWVASTEVMTGPLALPAAAKSPAAAPIVSFIEKVSGFNGGLRFSPDFDLSADLEARTEKGAGELAEGMRWLTDMAQSHSGTPGQPGRGLEGFKFRLNGKHILLSLHVPEAQVLAGVQQMRAAQGAQTAAAARQAPTAVQPPPPSSGLPPVPAGTIRVQSSDMGTVLLPAGNPKQ